MKQPAILVLRVIATPSVLSITAIQGCHHSTVTRAAPMTIEWADVDPGSPVRYLFDKNDVAVDLPVRSSIVVQGMVSALVPGCTNSDGRPQPEGLSFEPTTSAGAKFAEWTGARIDKEIALIVGDQVWTRAHVHGALSGMVQLDIPPKIHAREVQNLVDSARTCPK